MNGRQGGTRPPSPEASVPQRIRPAASAPISSPALLAAGTLELHPDDLPRQAACAATVKEALALASPSAAQTLDAVSWLSRELTVDRDARQMVALFLRAVHELLPCRALCARLFGDPGKVVEAVIGGTLRHPRGPSEDGPEIFLKRSALERLQLGGGTERMAGVRVVEREPELFDGRVGGFSVPLAAGGELYGALYVEHLAPLSSEGARELAHGDESAVIALVNQLSVALRNVRHVHESRFLRDYLAQIIEHTSAFILAIDRDARVTVLNQVLAKALGVRRRDVLGRPLHELIDPGTRAQEASGAAAATPREELRLLRERLLAALAGEDPGPLEVALGGRRGGDVRAVFNVTGIGSGTRREVAVAIGQDQTAIRLLERQVIQAEKLATLGQLAASVVHEINNPLTSIVACADFLLKQRERKGGEPQELDRLRRIVEGSERIQSFARDLVSYARPSSEEREEIALDDVLSQALSFCEHVIEEARARVTRELAPGLPRVAAIASQLQQVFVNLITNACHALAGRGGEVDIASFPCEGGAVGVRVRDTGSGIAREHLGAIFEPFFTTKASGQGTGLGLSIVRSIVESHGGRIEVRSEPGQGAAFTVILPAARWAHSTSKESDSHASRRRK